MTHDNPATCRTAVALTMTGTYEAVTPRFSYPTAEEVDANAERLLAELRAAKAEAEPGSLAAKLRLRLRDDPEPGSLAAKLSLTRRVGSWQRRGR